MKSIFVSSTFRDMHYERDIIQKTVAPIVNAEAKKHADSVSFCDLRWGIDTSDMEGSESEGKVLNVCLDTLDRSSPLMVIIIGERYGWIPSASVIEAAASRKQFTPKELDISITALEIEYGAFFKNKRALVYFREWESPTAQESKESALHQQKLAALKERLCALSGRQVKSYTAREENGKTVGLEGFAEMLTADVLAFLEEEWQETDRLSPAMREFRIHRHKIEERATLPTVFRDTEKAALSALEAGERLIAIEGQAGGGKSILFASLCKKAEALGFLVLPVICSYTAKTSSPVNVLRYFVGYLQEILGIEQEEEDLFSQEDDAEYSRSLKDATLASLMQHVYGETEIPELMEKLDDACAMCEERGLRLALMIDGEDKWQTNAASGLSCLIPSSLSTLSSITVLFTTSNPVQAPDALCLRLPALADSQAEEILEEALLDCHKELDKRVKQALLCRAKGKSPLYTKFMLSRLLMFDAKDYEKMPDIAAISAHQIATVSAAPDGLESLGASLIEAAAEKINPTLLKRVISFIALSDKGVGEEELRLLLGEEFNLLDFLHFVQYLQDEILIRENGSYDFDSLSVKAGLRAAIQDPTNDARALASVFETVFSRSVLDGGDIDFGAGAEALHLALAFYSLKELAAMLLRIREPAQSGAVSPTRAVRYETGIKTMLREEAAVLKARLLEDASSLTPAEKTALVDFFYDADSLCDLPQEEKKRLYEAFCALLATVPAANATDEMRQTRQTLFKEKILLAIETNAPFDTDLFAMQGFFKERLTYNDSLEVLDDYLCCLFSLGDAAGKEKDMEPSQIDALLLLFAEAEPLCEQVMALCKKDRDAYAVFMCHRLRLLYLHGLLLENKKSSLDALTYYLTFSLTVKLMPKWAMQAYEESYLGFSFVSEVHQRMASLYAENEMYAEAFAQTEAYMKAAQKWDSTFDFRPSVFSLHTYAMAQKGNLVRKCLKYLKALQSDAGEDIYGLSNLYRAALKEAELYLLLGDAKRAASAYIQGVEGAEALLAYRETQYQGVSNQDFWDSNCSFDALVTSSFEPILALNCFFVLEEIPRLPKELFSAFAYLKEHSADPSLWQEREINFALRCYEIESVYGEQDTSDE
ncbi:MAG: DUF4062 domain-containing protein [Clostridia bacterium]|nr:DUF4062 domain-containing protein [Clostridia bacterium]